MQPTLHWKKRPHVIKVQLHLKIVKSGVAAKFTLKYYYDTTVKAHLLPATFFSRFAVVRAPTPFLLCCSAFPLDRRP